MKYRMDNDTIVDTDMATQYWDNATYFDGHNRISRATGSQWEHETLYHTRKGKYYIEYTSQWQGSTPSAEWISKKTAAQWLIRNEHDLPDDLAKLAEEVIE